MDFRKVIKIKGTHYISIPLEVCKALEIRAGERLKVSYVTGIGIFITQARGADKIPVEPKSIEGLKKAADLICFQTETKLKNIASNSITNYFTSMIEKLSRLGIFEMQKRVDRLEKMWLPLGDVKERLRLVRPRKKSSG